jgi:2'-5' RNA ligase
MQKKSGMLNKMEGNFRPHLTIIYNHFAKITINHNFKNASHNSNPVDPSETTREIVYTTRNIHISKQ